MIDLALGLLTFGEIIAETTLINQRTLAIF